MAELFIRCKVKGKSFSTGLQVPAGALAESLKKSEIQCPHCGRTHEWSGKDAFFLNEQNQPIPLREVEL